MALPAPMTATDPAGIRWMLQCGGLFCRIYLCSGRVVVGTVRVGIDGSGDCRFRPLGCSYDLSLAAADVDTVVVVSLAHWYCAEISREQRAVFDHGRKKARLR